MMVLKTTDGFHVPQHSHPDIATTSQYGRGQSFGYMLLISVKFLCF